MMKVKYSYHVYCEYIDPDMPKFPKTMNTIMVRDSRILSEDDYSELKKAIVKKYDLKIDSFYVVITSLSYLGSTEA